MRVRNNSISHMDAFREHIVNVLANKMDLDEKLLAKLEVDEVCDVLRSIHHPFVTRSLNAMFLKILETKQQAFVPLLQIIFPEKAFKDIRNAIHFLDLTSWPGFAALQGTPRRNEVLSLFINLITKQTNQIKRYVFNEDIPDNELPILRANGLIAETEFPELSCFLFAEREKIYKHLSSHGVHYDVFPRQTIASSTSFPDDIFPKVVALISQWFSNDNSKKESGDANQLQPNALDYYRATSLIKQVYACFRRKHETSKSPADLEFLHQIIWLALTFLGKDADTGIFRPYAEIDSENAKMFIDYLLLDPHEHLLLFLMHNRGAQYSSLSKYGMGFDGTESSGSGFSGSGLEKMFNDVPIVVNLFEPALEKLYQKYDRDKSLCVLWEMLKRDWIRPQQISTSLHPTVLRRASVPTLIKLIRNGTPRLRREVQKVVTFLVTSPEGIPNTSDKVFFEISKEKDMFSGARRTFVFRLITTDIERSVYKMPTNYFAFECLLRLIASGYKSAEPMLVKLISNVEFQKRDNFDFDILANIERLCETDSPLLKKAVKVYQTSSEWQKHVSHYSEETANRIINEGVSKGTLSSNDIDISSDSPDSSQRLQKQLIVLAEKNFSDFVATIRRVQGVRRLADAFKDRLFIINALEKEIRALGKIVDLPDKVVTTSLVIGLMNDLAADPDPLVSDENDERIRAGQSMSCITGVRPRLCYSICDALAIRPLILDLWNITKRLMSDENSYVVYHAFNPFIEILRRRNWNASVRDESVRLLWSLTDSVTFPAHVKKLFEAFCFVRELSEDDAEKVLIRFWDQEGVERLLLFYAVYRKQHEADMGVFDNTRFVALLEKAIDEENSNLPLRILRAVTQVCHQDKGDAVLLVPYLLRYTKRSHAQSEIIQENVTIIEQLFDMYDRLQVKDIRQIILNTTRLQFSLLQNKDEATQYVWTPSLDDKVLKNFFTLDRDGFYEYLSLIDENLSSCDNLPFLNYEFFEVLRSESDPVKRQQIRVFADNLVSHHPRFFPMRQMWLDHQKEKSSAGTA